MFRTTEKSKVEHPGRIALDYDVVILVGDYVELLERGRVYREYGLEVHHYPLSPRDSPTIFSLLGIVGFILEHLENCKSILIEGFGGEKLIEYALYLMNIWPQKPPIQDLQSPLHVRSIFILEQLARSNVNLKVEARRNIIHAFTGGDAHKSDIIEHSIDILASLKLDETREFGVCPSEIYSCIVNGRCSLAEPCSEIIEVAESFDYSNTGAIKCIAIKPLTKMNKAWLYVGCRMLAVDDCLPEVEAGYKKLKKLLFTLKMGRMEGYTVVSPEEAACILYSERMGYPCSEEELL
jgi:hypothetical protein